MAESDSPDTKRKDSATPAKSANAQSISSETNGKYIIREPVSYATRAFGQPAVAPVVERAEAPRAAALPAEAALPTTKHAVWIVHGMGQQVPFETLDSLTQGILDVGALIPGHPPRVTSTRFAGVSPGASDQVVQRVELDLQNPIDPGQTCQVHLYEAYWAPATEGVAKLSDIISFFFQAGFRGFLNCFQPFHRAMFPDQNAQDKDPGWQRFYVHKRTAAEILLTLLLLLSLIAINGVVLAASADKANIFNLDRVGLTSNWRQLTALATAVSAVALAYGLVLFLGEFSKPCWLSSSAKKATSILGWIGFGVTAASLIIAAALMTASFRWQWAQNFLQGMHVHSIQAVSTAFLLLTLGLFLVALWGRGVKRSRGSDTRRGRPLAFLFFLAFVLHVAVIAALIWVGFHPLPPLSALPAWVPGSVRHLAYFLTISWWVWPALIFLSKQIRQLLVQFVGDVVIYVDSNKLDRFNAVRQEIKRIALNSLTPLYTAVDHAQNFIYSKVAVVGHSLGSVIAYDALNKLLVLDGLTNNQIGVAQRTVLLETFGSPLDKIAYFFTIQGKESFHIREELAAVVQPLIQSYARYRAFDWVNVYSRNDIISGRLTFYDLPNEPTPPGIDNLEDLDAVVPLVAHTDYWKNPLVWQELLKRVGP